MVKIRARVGLGWALFMLGACGGSEAASMEDDIVDAGNGLSLPGNSSGDASGNTAPPASLRSVDVPAPPPLEGASAPNFSLVQGLLKSRCSNSPACHSSQQPQNLDNVDLATDPYNTLLNGTSSATGKAFVVAGAPQDSYLYEKIAVDQPTVGSRMPLGPQGLTDEEVAAVGQWIAAGALND